MSKKIQVGDWVAVYDKYHYYGYLGIGQIVGKDQTRVVEYEYMVDIEYAGEGLKAMRWVSYEDELRLATDKEIIAAKLKC